jgi:calcium-dependent protein kinase
MGAILYILLSGVPPFNGDNDSEILEQVRLLKYSFDIPEFKAVSDEAKDLIR